MGGDNLYLKTLHNVKHNYDVKINDTKWCYIDTKKNTNVNQ